MDTNWDKSKLDRLMGTSYNSTSGMAHHEANILKQVLADGAYKVFQDTPGEYQRIEILLKDGKTIVLHKEISTKTRLERFKKLEIFSADNQLLDEMELIAEDHLSMNPTYRFFYQHTTLGTGKGEIGLYLAYKLLDLQMDMRYISGSYVDEDVLKTIKEATSSKNY